MSKKIKVLTISDHPLSPSGVGTQTKYVIEALLKSGKFEVISLGGAIRHNDYRPIRVEPYGEEWRIIPVDGYGTQDMIRSALRTEKPDILYFMTDPRFYGWLWDMENEIRPLVPMVYYHVWDNYPAPHYNHKYYVSNDRICAISKVTRDIVAEVAPEVKLDYVPHAVDSEIFKPLENEAIQKMREDNLIEEDRNKVIFFWNNRNARRKQSGSLVFWFKKFLDRVGHDKACLIMHTDPKDGHGQDLGHIVEHLGLDTQRQVMFSTQKVNQGDLAALYNMVDCTINISDAEGFGLATLESLSCGTPIIANMTGGLQEQIRSGSDLFGIPLFPESKAVIGSQDVPYIYEDRLSEGQVVSALEKMFVMTPEERKELGMKGREHVMKNYNFETFNKQWVDIMTEIHEQEGSWETRTNYNGIRFLEVA
jgi:glycosyltransferase involved in cell wall biosynthesis